MKTFRTIVIVFLGLGLLLITSSTFKGKYLAQDQESCAIYDSFFATLDYPESYYIHPKPYDLRDTNDSVRFNSPPDGFAGNFKTLERIGVSREVIVTDGPLELFRYDSSDFHNQLFDYQSDVFEKCPRPSTPKITFRSKSHVEAQRFTEQPTIGRVSRIAYSADGNTGMFIFHKDCGGLCGSRSYILMRKHNRIWEKIGESTFARY